MVGNDRDTGEPDPDATESGTPRGRRPPSLDAALGRLRLDGAIFFRAEFTEGWSYASPAAVDDLANSLRPGADRLILFHIVARGSAWVALEDGERHWAREGSVIVLPYGDPHRMGGLAAAESVPIFSLLAPPPWHSLPVLRHGGGGERAEIVCGYLHSKDPVFDPALGALPPVFVVDPPEGPAAQWVRSSVDYALEVSSEASGAAATSTRLPELVLVEVLRLHLSSLGQAGWFGALSDPVLAPALAHLHAAPERKWTVAQLASQAAVSRSLLDERFRQVLGRPPIRYLTEWRMHLAAELLASTDLGVMQIARRVGYHSEEAFSRAFKRAHGSSPSVWRAGRLASSRPVTLPATSR